MVTFLVLLGISAVGYYLIRHEQKTLSEEITLRGSLIASQLGAVDPSSFNIVAMQKERERLADSLATVDRSPAFFQNERALKTLLSEAGKNRGVVQAAYFDWSGNLVLSYPESPDVKMASAQDDFNFIEPIIVRNDTLGYAQVRFNPAILKRAMNDALTSIVPVLLGILAGSILLSLLFSLIFTVPISRLKRHAQEMAKGNLTARVKMRSRDELGVLGNVFNKMAKNLQRTYDELAEKLAEIRRLFKMATEDGLTGVYVKRYFLELLAGEMQRSLRYNRPLSFLMCDIDNFKKINDTYGHPAGDAVLKALSRRLMNGIREGVDLIGRYGGEEFAIMLPEIDENSAYKIAERLRHSVENDDFYLGDVEGVNVDNIKVTISMGITTAKREVTLEKLIACADKALYISKKNGRNQSTALALDALNKLNSAQEGQQETVS